MFIFYLRIQQKKSATIVEAKQRCEKNFFQLILLITLEPWQKPQASTTTFGVLKKLA